MYSFLKSAIVEVYSFIELFVRFIPESTRWYVVHGRYKDAEKAMRRVAKINNVQFPQNFILSEPFPTKAANDWAIFDLFRNRRMGIYLLICFGVWY